MPANKLKSSTDLFGTPIPGDPVLPPKRRGKRQSDPVAASTMPAAGFALSRPDEAYLTDKQVAARFGVSRPTIWRWTKEHDDFPPPMEIFSGTSRWRLSDLRAFEANLRSKAGKSK